MTYQELNDLFIANWANEKGVIKGAPVMFICRMNAFAKGPDSIVDEALLEQELKLAKLSLSR